MNRMKEMSEMTQIVTKLTQSYDSLIEFSENVLFFVSDEVIDCFNSSDELYSSKFDVQFQRNYASN